MDIQHTLPKVKELVEKAKDIAVLTHSKPTMDSIGSTLSLYLGLLGLGKRVNVVAPDPMTVEFSSFIAANKLATKIGGKKNFIISLDYKEGSIDKVSYNIEGDKINLVIEPRPGFDFSKDNVNYTTGGGKADLIIILDTVHLGELGHVYEEDKEAFTDVPLINIDCHPNNTMFGAANLVDPKSPTTAELTAVVMSFLGVKLTKDIATNLLNALYATTSHFQDERVNARTFEVASVCMKAGAERFTASPSKPVVQFPVENVKKDDLVPKASDMFPVGGDSEV